VESLNATASEDLGFAPRGEAGAFTTERNTALGGKLPLNTDGGGLSYLHSGMYGMYALPESVRQMRGTAPPRSPRRQDLGLPRPSAACSRLRHDHQVERGALSRDVQAEFALLAFPTYNIVIVPLDRASGDPLSWAYRSGRQWPES
jgi:hypothetical protein